MMMPVTGNNATAIQLPFSDSNSSRVAHVKLQQWAEDELSSNRKNNRFSSSSSSSAAWGSGGSCDEFERTKKLLILRKATVEYGIATATKPHTTTRATAPGSGVDCICTQSPKCCEIHSTPDPLAVTTTMPHTAARATAPRSGTDCIHNQVNVADG